MLSWGKPSRGACLLLTESRCPLHQSDDGVDEHENNYEEEDDEEEEH